MPLSFKAEPALVQRLAIDGARSTARDRARIFRHHLPALAIRPPIELDQLIVGFGRALELLALGLGYAG